MKLGSKRARKLFPNLLTLLEDIAQEPKFLPALKAFAKKSAQVPVWVFIPWINQILSMFGGSFDEVGQALGPLLVRVAEKFPESIRFQFQFTYDQMFSSGTQRPDVSQKPFVEQLLKTIPKSNLLYKILSGMTNLCMPEIKAGDFLSWIDKTMTSPTLNRDGKMAALRTESKRFKEEFEASSDPKVGGSVHPKFFNKFRAMLGKVIDLAMECKDINALAKALANARKTLKESA